MVHIYLPPVSDSGAALTGGTGGTDMLVVQGGIDSAGVITDTVFAYDLPRVCTSVGACGVHRHGSHRLRHGCACQLQRHLW